MTSGWVGAPSNMSSPGTESVVWSSTKQHEIGWAHTLRV